MAEIVRDSLYYHARTKYTLWAYVIMPNHVHVLLKPTASFEEQFKSVGTPSSLLGKADCNDPADRCTSTNSLMYKGPIPAILHGLRSYTANQANKVLGRTGKFWNDEVYDHWIRNDDEFQRILCYIERNPVKANLVKFSEDWRFSSAYDRAQMKIGPFDKLPYKYRTTIC